MVLASTGAVLARGEAVMVTRDFGHFARHQEWLAQQDATASLNHDGTNLNPSKK
jgi:hypothetical protein